MDQRIQYKFFHWGPFLYKTKLFPEKIKKIKILCEKNKKKDYRSELAGLIEHEYQIDSKKLFPMIFPYLNSYSQAYTDYAGKIMGTKIELTDSWVNYMTKFESNPLHSHDEDFSFVIYIDVPKKLKQEVKNTVGNTQPGAINFIYSLENTKHTINRYTFIPEIGDFFIFPASLNHSVNHFQSEGERVSVSGNLKVSYEN
tara:strand:- start:33 stop:629 length:597 start_codon:yes stop_codon:yes gene_type:complete